MESEFMKMIVFNIIFWSILGFVSFIGRVAEQQKDEAYFKEYGVERRKNKNKEK